MKKIKTLTVLFDKVLKPNEIPKFRGAVLGKIDQPDLLFHNHFDKEQFVYEYPKIQYKTINKKAAFFCVEEGVEIVHQFFNLKDWSLQIGSVNMNMGVDSLKVNKFLIQAWDKYFTYNINSWLALNEKNYPLYKNLKSLDEKHFFLENILRGNILSFGKGIDCIFDREVKVQIKKIKKEHPRDFKGIKMHAIDAEFKTNVFLPNYLGLGKGVSIGFGVVEEKRNISKNEN
ncbi:MAG: CRISPR-associated endonuclease Cas6 [Bacteroidales bacterium]|nr:CRISPR-associated endonuclease Cas6 [Bacteroidales bacterium]